MKPSKLRCEYLVNPLAVRCTAPRLMWIPPCDQAAWQVVVTCEGDTVWDSGKVSSDATVIEYDGQPLRELHRYEWKVKVWDCDDRESDWSDSAFFGTGPAGVGWTYEPAQDVTPPDIFARWISPRPVANWSETDAPPSPMLRREFQIDQPISRAVLYASALGLYDAYLNGQRIGDHVLAPEWTDYRTKVQYQSYDVTECMRKGANALGAILGPGWYAGRVGMADSFANSLRGLYGRRMGFIALLRITLANGEVVNIVTDPDWTCTTAGPIRGSDLLDGEFYDARCEQAGWNEEGFDTSEWQQVDLMKGPKLVPQPNEPIRITRRLPAQTITEVSPNVWIADFGQNLVGWCRLRMHNTKADQEVILRHAEMLDADGNAYLENMRGAHPVDTYICRGADQELFEPRFTYHGFRYVEITGLKNAPSQEDIIACALHSAPAETGHFECSSDMANRIMQAIQWTQRDNLHSTPTDCPQRDERLGWMGDAQVFSQTSMFNMDMAAFYQKWLADVREAQADDGRFPDIAPHPYDPNQRFSGNPGWADAGIIIPWRMYVNYGDCSILTEQFDAARRYIDWCHKSNPDLIWRNRSQMTPLWYGDWLNGDTFTGLVDWPSSGGEVSKELYSTAFFAYSAQLLAKMATVLQQEQDAVRYNELSADIRRAFNEAFVRSDGSMEGDTQAGYALALDFDLLPESLRPSAAGRMVEALKPYGGALSTGIQSTVRLMLSLSRFGYHDEAYALFMRNTMPSWGYMVEHGGTTIWERWDGWVEGRGFQNSTMNSYNHYAIGAVGEWVYRVIGGLNPDEAAPGWKHFYIRPVPGGGLTWANTGYESIRGLIQSNWRIENDAFMLEAIIPPNTTATIQLPDDSAEQTIESGKHHFECKINILKL